MSSNSPVTRRDNWVDSAAAPGARERTRAIASPLSRCVLGMAVIASLAACGDDLPELSGAGGSSVAAQPVLNLQLTPGTVATGQSATLTWSASDVQSCSASGGWSGAQPTSGTLSTKPVTSTTSYTLTCTGPRGTVTQSKQVVVSKQAPVVTLVASPATISSLGTSNLTWSASNAEQCTASGGWHGEVATKGTWSTGRLSNTTDYKLTCEGPGGSATQSATVTVSALAPTVSIHASPSSVSSGDASTLSWSSENATACTASGAWSGSKGTSGSQSTGSLQGNSIYSLTCKGLGGSATQSATVTVTSAAPAISLSAKPSTIASGGASTLTWSAADATACTASGAWSGSKVTRGSESTGALAKSTTYTLSCTGPGGRAEQSTTVSVKTPLPTVSLSVGPSAIASGASATITWSSAQATACIASGAWSGDKALSGSQSTGALTANKTYTLTCTGAGGSAAQSATVSVKAAAPTVSLSASPSSITRGGTASLVWSSTHATSCTASGAWSGAKSVSGSQSTGALTANAVYSLTCTGAGGVAMQSATVTVTSTPTATVSLSASPSTVVSGGTSTLTWSSRDATSCTASGAWAGSKPTSGSQSTGALTASATYSLTCSGAGGNAAQSTTVSVTPAAPTVSLVASPSTITSGGSAGLTWSSTHATACTAGGAWSGAKALSGSQSTGALKANTTYSLTCTGAGGSATQAATVSVTPITPAPTVSLAASPSSIVSGKSTMLTWSSTNATSCTASGGWSGSHSTSGSQSTGTLSANATYTLTCTGGGGSAAQSATVTVASAAPTVSLSASPSTVASGAASTLSWSSTNATACVASGGWSGSEPTSGSHSTGTLSANESYTLTCTGSGGSASQSATVTVTSAAPTVTLSANPSTVASGGVATLTWSSTGATSCAASGGWSGSEAASGSHNTAALTGTTTYTLTCTGTGGSAAQSVTVTVPTGSGTATLTWAAPTENADGSTPVTAPSGYTIYYGTSPSALTQSVTVSGSSTSYTLTGLAPGAWYFAVAADAADGTPGALSNVGSTII